MVLRLPAMATAGGDEPPTLDVRVSLKESAYANANTLFAKYRSSKEKSQKTIEASTKALKAAEETARKQLAEARKRSKQSAAGSVPGGKRKVLWFEKFHWFVTSDNYLVIAGRDAHQNELLVKRYLRPGDAYLHADVHGAASCILRAKRRRRQQHKGGTTEVVPLSEQALREAGNFTICRSSAWTSRMVTSAWWVESHQVSKTAPTGEYLTVGSFMIRGKKNFLPPTQLEMGLGVLFLLGDEDSILRHKNERRDFALLGDSEDDDEMENQSEKNGQEATAKTNGRTQSTAVEKSSGSSQRPPKSVANGEPVEDTLPANGVTVDQSNDASGGAENLQDDDDDDEQEPKGGLSDNAQKPKQKKRGLSARDRRLIKKYGSLEAAEKALAAREDDDQASEAPSTRSEVSTEPKTLKRGQKAKQKKMMKKYADQDEEDRELAMLALQGGEKSQKKKKTSKRDAIVSEKQQQVAAETVALLVKDASTVAEQLPDEVRSILAECVTVRSPNEKDDEAGAVRWDKFDADTIEQLLGLEPVDAQVAAAGRVLELKRTTRVDNFSACLGGIIRTIRKHGYKDLGQGENGDAAPRKSKAEKDKEESQWKRTMEEEGVMVDDDLDDDAVDDTAELSKLTGKPQAEDMLLSAVPVCAPYQTLSQYTYRVKLTPGNMKRGKASKQCVDMYLKATSKKGSDGADRQLDLIKRVGDNDWVQAICGDVKLATAGASKMAKKNKANIKKKSKAGK